MIRKVASMISGLTLMYGVSNCGPDTVNNYYSGGKTPSGVNGNYTCGDFGEAQWACLTGVDPLDHEYADLVAQTCRKANIPQECIDCVATAPCEYFESTTGSDMRVKDPLTFCSEQGSCPFY